MAQYHNITQYSEAGEPWSMPGRGEFQTFFLDIEGVEGTVTTNKKKGNSPKLGQVYGTLEDTGKLGKKGQKIYKFKQEQVPDGVGSAPANLSGQREGYVPVQPADRGTHAPEWFAPYAIMIKQIHEHLITGTTPTVEAPKAEEKVEELAGTSMTKAELEDIFGGSMDVVDIED